MEPSSPGHSVSTCSSDAAGAARGDPKVERRRNPRRRRSREDTAKLRRAIERYEGFHWGEQPRRIKRSQVSPPPRAGVKLGKLVALAYETRKDGERAIWEHDFGEEGGKRPDLVMDVDNDRLHIVGGDYRVEDAGIID